MAIKRKKILVFSAHPDDAEASMGGTILRYAEEKNEVLIVNVTSNAVREREGRNAALALKAKVDFMGYTDVRIPVDADSVRTLLHGRHSQTRIEMNIGNQGNGNLFSNAGNGLGRRHIRDRHPDDFAASLLQLLNLPDRGLDIIGHGIGHRLDRNRRAATDGHRTDMDLTSYSSRDHSAPCISPFILRRFNSASEART